MKHFTQTYSRKNGTRRYINVQVGTTLIYLPAEILNAYKTNLTFI